MQCARIVMALATSLLPAYAGAQEVLEARSVHPADGATGVPINTSVQIRVRGALFVPPPEGLASALLLVREDGEIGAPLAVYGEALEFAGSIARRVDGADTGLAGSVADRGFTLWTAPLELEPETRYELSSRVLGCAEDGTVVPCLGQSYVRIATFETGSERDLRAPVARLSGPAAPGAQACEWLLPVTAEDVEAAPEAMRFVLSNVEGSWGELGPGPVVGVRAPREPPAQATLSIAAVDPSGNMGAAVAVELPACPDPWSMGSDVPMLEDDVRTDAASCTIQLPRQRRPLGRAYLGLMALTLAAGLRRGLRRGARPPRNGRSRGRGSTLALRPVRFRRPA